MPGAHTMPSATITRRSGFLAWADEHSLVLLIIACSMAAVFWELFDLFLQPQYPIADFLINYSQGFVRRGFTGEIILLLARLTHMPPAWMTVLVQLAIYGYLLRGIYVLAAPLRRDMLWYAMLFSPATLPMMILVPGNGVRKEMLLHIALLTTIFLVPRRMNHVVLSLTLAAMFAALILSHETLGCCLPYFVAVVAIEYRSLREVIKITALPFIIAGVLEVLVRQNMGTLQTAIGICSSVGGKWVGANDSFNLCAGAIGHLSWTPEMYHAEELVNLHYWPLYSVLYVLAMAPLVAAIILLYRSDRLRVEALIIASTAVVCAFASLPLFYFAIDWGRWIWMQTICLLLVILTAAQRAPSFQVGSTMPAIGHGKPWRKFAMVAVFLYCVAWTMPVLGMQETRYGYLALIPAAYREYEFHRHQLHYDQIDRGF